MSINIIVSTFDAQNKTRIPHSLYSNDRRKEFLEKIANNHLPQPILLDMKEDLPKVHEPEEYGSHLRFDDEFWNELLKYNAGVLLSLPTLQKKGAEITRGLSWEQTVEDFAAELHLFPQLMAVSEFRHLLLPLASDDFASEGLIHIRNVKKKTGATSRLRGSLYFSPDKGLNKIQLSDKALLLLLNQDWDEPRPTAPFGNDKIVSVRIPDFVLAEPLPNEARSTKRWYILNQTLESAPVHRINIAVAIVRAGLNKVLNCWWKKTDGSKNSDLWETLTRVEYWNPQDRAPDFVTLPASDRPAMPAQSRRRLPVIKGDHDDKDGFCLTVPIGEFGNLIAAEREQIESLCSIKKLIQNYLKDDTVHTKPISIAVFAPPGAGKSFAVKEIAKPQYDEDDTTKAPMEFNVAQFQTPKDLTHAFRLIRNTIKSRKDYVPLVFFDEFDCTLEKQELGWLKYFLAPMQDGIFYDDDENERKLDKIGRAIFVFTGGVYTSFEEFDPRTEFFDEDLRYAVSEEYRKQIKEFEQKKGPDFISRLRGHINIPDANAEPGHSKHFIRRAIQLRGLLKGKLRLNDDSNGMVNIREEVVYALLTVDRYRHGVRSMEAILRMSLDEKGWISAPSLPSRAQLNMHVDAEEFFIRLRRGRSRMETA